MELNRAANTKLFSYMVVLSILLLLISPRLDFVRSAISVLYGAGNSAQLQNGKEMRSYISLFSNIVDLKNENEQFQVENIKLHSKIDSLAYILDENETLKESMSVVEKDSRLIDVYMFTDESLEIGYIDRGRTDGVGVDSVLFKGSFYIGIVERVDEKSAVVMLPHNRGSKLRVSIVKPVDLTKGSYEDLKKEITNRVKSTGILVGGGKEVLVENISTNKGVADGDLVVVSDPKVGKHLVVGTISNLDGDPSSASLKSGIELAFDIAQLNRYYIEIK